MRQRLLRGSGLLAAVLLLQWAVGLAGCIASLSAKASPDLIFCHADGTTTSVPSGSPMEHGPDVAACPLCVQLAATMLPDPPDVPPVPPLAHAAATLPRARDGWVPVRATPAHPARGPPTLA